MKLTDRLFKFIEGSPTSYHAARRLADELSAAGYVPVSEGAPLKAGGKYYLTRGGSVIAFRMRDKVSSFNITASHSDSPSFKINFIPESSGVYTRLSVESYGGAINYTWLDRPLSVAGRVMVSDGGALTERLVDLDADIAVIPSVAPHLMRSINSSFAPNVAVDMQPLFTIEKSSLLNRVAAALGISRESILSHELYMLPRQKPTYIGAEGELILAPRIDDLASVYTALEAFLAAPDTESVPVLAVFDHEEIGSATKEGAASDMLSDVLALICPDEGVRKSALASSLMLSVDGAHALHPNHPELSDPINRPILGGGVALKYNANRRYATDLVSDAILRAIAAKRGITLQVYANRADLPGGSTLGSIAARGLAVPTVDIGIPQLAMHSAVETCAAADVDAMYELLLAFYSSEIGSARGGLTVK